MCRRMRSPGSGLDVTGVIDDAVAESDTAWGSMTSLSPKERG